VTRLPKASRALTVKVLTEPARACGGNPLTVSTLTAAGLTRMLAVAVSRESDVSVTVSCLGPAVRKVTGKVCVPRSAGVKV